MLTVSRTDRDPLVLSLSSPSPAALLFQQYLDDTWPEKTLHRGSAVIRNTLYEKIVETLRGGEAKARFKLWVIKWEFFLMEPLMSPLTPATRLLTLGRALRRYICSLTCKHLHTHPPTRDLGSSPTDGPYEFIMS